MFKHKYEKFQAVLLWGNHTKKVNAEIRGGSCWCSFSEEIVELLPEGKIGIGPDYVKEWKPFDDASLKYFKGEHYGN